MYSPPKKILTLHSGCWQSNSKIQSTINILEKFMEGKHRPAPSWLSHKPVISVDYEEQDGNAGDAKFLSIGRSTWNKEDFSAKVWRQNDSGYYSRQRVRIKAKY